MPRSFQNLILIGNVYTYDIFGSFFLFNVVTNEYACVLKFFYDCLLICIVIFKCFAKRNVVFLHLFIFFVVFFKRNSLPIFR